MVAEGTRVTSRTRVLDAVRVALGDVAPSEKPEQVQVPRNYDVSRPGDPGELFAERVAEYRGVVRRIDAAAVPSTVRDICRAAQVTRLVVPPQIDQAWLPDAAWRSARRELSFWTGAGPPGDGQSPWSPMCTSA